MKELNKYILEKFKISKDININQGYILDEISDFINDYMQGTCKLKTTDFIFMFQNDKGTFIRKNERDDVSELARMYLYSKKENFKKDIDKIAKDIESGLNKIKKVKRTEVFATSIYFYFEDYEES